MALITLYIKNEYIDPQTNKTITTLFQVIKDSRYKTKYVTEKIATVISIDAVIVTKTTCQNGVLKSIR